MDKLNRGGKNPSYLISFAIAFSLTLLLAISFLFSSFYHPLIEDKIITAYASATEETEKNTFSYTNTAEVIFSLSSARVSANFIGEKIFVYSQPSLEADTIAILKDGENIEVSNYNSEFFMLNYKGNIGYIKSANVAFGLTYYQKLAIIICGVCLITVISLLGLAYLNKNKGSKK